MTQVAQNIVNGLALGCVYAGFALGLSLLLGILGIVNVAHSAMLMLAALVYWELVNALGLDLLVAILPVLVLFFLLGLGLQRSFTRRLEREAESTVLLVFFGVMVVIESLAVMLWTTDTRNVALGYLDGTLRLGGISLPASRLVAAVLTLVLFGATYLFLTRTLVGAAIRGLAQNRDVAAMAGIPVGRLSLLVFAGGVALAAFGGVVLGMTLPFSPQEHVRWLAWSFLIVIVGGLGNVASTLLAGIALGLIEVLVGSFLSFQYTYLIIYLLLAIALLARREGLRGTPARTL
ncbi:MAG TPA: branched-chain amino acid ABC transporter permease [Actinomycetes bacterium]|nr:branched-chain amino acid ABC transporter permease [Actinomycetes bacterium]